MPDEQLTKKQIEEQLRRLLNIYTPYANKRRDKLRALWATAH